MAEVRLSHDTAAPPTTSPPMSVWRPSTQCTPVAVEVQLQKYIDETGPGHFAHVPKITEAMCKLPAEHYGADSSAAAKALQLLEQCATQVCFALPRSFGRRAHPTFNVR